jgi:hypothetical protein
MRQGAQKCERRAKYVDSPERAEKYGCADNIDLSGPQTDGGWPHGGG